METDKIRIAYPLDGVPEQFTTESFALIKRMAILAVEHDMFHNVRVAIEDGYIHFYIDDSDGRGVCDVCEGDLVENRIEYINEAGHAYDRS